MPTLVKPEDCVTHCPAEMANLFAHTFHNKQIDEKLNILLSYF